MYTISRACILLVYLLGLLGFGHRCVMSKVGRSSFRFILNLLFLMVILLRRLRTVIRYHCLNFIINNKNTKIYIVNK